MNKGLRSNACSEYKPIVTNNGCHMIQGNHASDTIVPLLVACSVLRLVQAASNAFLLPIRAPAANAIISRRRLTFVAPLVSGLPLSRVPTTEEGFTNAFAKVTRPSSLRFPASAAFVLRFAGAKIVPSTEFLALMRFRRRGKGSSALPPTVAVAFCGVATIFTDAGGAKDPPRGSGVPVGAVTCRMDRTVGPSAS